MNIVLIFINTKLTFSIKCYTFANNIKRNKNEDNEKINQLLLLTVTLLCSSVMMAQVTSSSDW
jgi:hypothetical protein